MFGILLFTITVRIRTQVITCTIRGRQDIGKQATLENGLAYYYVR